MKMKEKMAYELSNCVDLTEKEFLDVYVDITSEKHNFMMVDCIGGKIYRNFEKYVKQE